MASSLPERELFLFRLNRLAVLTGNPLRRLCEGVYGISRREWRMILTLGLHGSLLSTRLADLSRIDAVRTSRAVSLLVQKRLVRRVPRPSDRRFVEIHLTPEGQAIFDALYPRVLAFDQRLLAVLAPQERVLLDDVMVRLEQEAANWPADPALPKSRRSGRLGKP